MDETLQKLLTNLRERSHEGEDLEIEFKSGKGGIPENLWETVCAFANTKRGWILLGVKGDHKNAVVEGLSNPSGMLDTFFTTSRNPSKINRPVCNEEDAYIERFV